MGFQPIGINTQETYPDDINDQSGFGLGDTGMDGDGNGAVYVQAGAAIAADAAVLVDDAFAALELTTALAAAATNRKVGVARVAVASGERFWAVTQLNQGVSVLGISGTVDNVPIFSSATDGVVDDVSAAHWELVGLVLTATTGGGTLPTPAFSANNVRVSPIIGA